MRFLADMGVSESVVQWLRSAGHGAVHLREQGLGRLPDPAVFQKAEAERRVIITFDLGFGEIVASSHQTVSVIVYRLRNARATHQVRRLQAVLGLVADIKSGHAWCPPLAGKPYPLALGVGHVEAGPGDVALGQHRLHVRPPATGRQRRRDPPPCREPSPPRPSAGTPAAGPSLNPPNFDAHPRATPSA